MQIKVIFRNETPIHSSAPGKSTIKLDGGINTPDGGFPLTRMRTLRVPSINGDGILRTKPLPLVPGNTMRNLLRRAALTTVFQPLRGKETLDIAAYAAACSGNASGNPEGNPSPFDETVKMRNHVFLGLFGGGPRMLKGLLSVDSMYPIVPDASRIIGEGYEDRIATGPILDIVWQRRVDPIEKLDLVEPEQLISDGPAAITAWSLRNQETKSKKKKSSEEEDETTSRGLNAFNAQEVVVPGIDWLWSIRLDRPTHSQVGLVLKAIQDISQQKMQVAGGHAKDYGKVEIQEISLDGQSIWNGPSYDDRVLPYFDALAESLDRISAQDFAEFVKSRKEE